MAPKAGAKRKRQPLVVSQPSLPSRRGRAAAAAAAAAAVTTVSVRESPPQHVSASDDASSEAHAAKRLKPTDTIAHCIAACDRGQGFAAEETRELASVEPNVLCDVGYMNYLTLCELLTTMSDPIRALQEALAFLQDPSVAITVGPHKFGQSALAHLVRCSSYMRSASALQFDVVFSDDMKQKESAAALPVLRALHARCSPQQWARLTTGPDANTVLAGAVSARHGRPGMMEALLELGIEIDLKKESGVHVFYHAIRVENFTLLRSLLDRLARGENPEFINMLLQCDMLKVTPLMAAVIQCKTAAVGVLLAWQDSLGLDLSQAGHNLVVPTAEALATKIADDHAVSDPAKSEAAHSCRELLRFARLRQTRLLLPMLVTSKYIAPDTFPLVMQYLLGAFDVS